MNGWMDEQRKNQTIQDMGTGNPQRSLAGRRNSGQEKGLGLDSPSAVWKERNDVVDLDKTGG